MPVTPLAMPAQPISTEASMCPWLHGGRLQGLAWRAEASTAEASTVTASAAEHFKVIRRQGISC
jgi:hypothetical protein